MALRRALPAPLAGLAPAFGWARLLANPVYGVTAGGAVTFAGMPLASAVVAIDLCSGAARDKSGNALHHE